ncbi:hypothetical protein J6590_023962 [Homalodisca vitripennis]|nr:hypothetical protein J6590_023962 [Homalodisca vitripennis]
MVLVVEKTGTGKPCLVVGNYKYRESHTLTNGDFAWRCLGRLCTATVRTDSERSTILLHKDNHSGKHPQTFRNVTPLTSPLQNNNSVDYGSSFSSLALSPLVSQVVKKVKTEERSIQTDDECLKSKDELLNRITELTRRQSALIDKIQNLQLELEANEHGRISSSSNKVDVAIGCDIPHQHDADPQTELSFNVPSFECKQCEKEKQRVKYYKYSNFHFQIELAAFKTQGREKINDDSLIDKMLVIADDIPIINRYDVLREPKIHDTHSKDGHNRSEERLKPKRKRNRKKKEASKHSSVSFKQNIIQRDIFDPAVTLQ